VEEDERADKVCIYEIMKVLDLDGGVWVLLFLFRDCCFPLVYGIPTNVQKTTLHNVKQHTEQKDTP
jgi:hypothetical protein